VNFTLTSLCWWELGGGSCFCIQSLLLNKPHLKQFGSVETRWRFGETYSRGFQNRDVRGLFQGIIISLIHLRTRDAARTNFNPEDGGSVFRVEVRSCCIPRAYERISTLKMEAVCSTRLYDAVSQGTALSVLSAVRPSSAGWLAIRHWRCKEKKGAKTAPMSAMLRPEEWFARAAAPFTISSLGASALCLKYSQNYPCKSGLTLLLHSWAEKPKKVRQLSTAILSVPDDWGGGVIPSTQRFYHSFSYFTIYYYLNSYMFRSYDHLQVEIYLLGFTRLTTDPLFL
jgi:hypothetical protein